MSPRTKDVHLQQHLATFGAVCVIVHQRQRLDAHSFTSTKSHGVNEGLTNGL
jgi:hypothetical protein